jgi:hypothetical protein
MKLTEHDKHEILSMLEFKRLILHARKMREINPNWNPWIKTQ